MISGSRRGAYLAWVRTQPCCAPKSTQCFGPMEAHHHTGGRGRGQKSDDRRSMPLCKQHHTEFHMASGAFGAMDKAGRREWQDGEVARCQALVLSRESVF